MQALRLNTKERPGRLGERVTKVFVDFVDAAAATAAKNLLQVRVWRLLARHWARRGM